MLEALTIALSMLLLSKPLPQQSQLLASTEVARAFQHSTMSVSKPELLMFRLHSAGFAWEAYLELLMPDSWGSGASHRIGINGDDTLALDLGKFSMTDNTLSHCTIG